MRKIIPILGMILVFSLASFAFSFSKGWSTVITSGAIGCVSLDNLKVLKVLADSDEDCFIKFYNRWIQGGSIVNLPVGSNVFLEEVDPSGTMGIIIYQDKRYYTYLKWFKQN